MCSHSPSTIEYKEDWKKLCLDFVNTMEWRGRENPIDNLKTYQDFVDWGFEKGLLREDESVQISDLARANPEKSEQLLKRIKALRETLYCIFVAIIQNENAEERDLERLNKALSKALGHSTIVQTEDGFGWEVAGNKLALDWILNPILHSAAEALTSGDLHRLRECADQQCKWLFWDKSRNRSKRWCSMNDCGNRAKAKSFYERKKIEGRM